MTEYKSNAHKNKEVIRETKVAERKTISKVTNGVAKKKKKSSVGKFSEVFLAEDVTSVKNYIIEEVLLPAAKKAISDIVTNGIDMMLYGETGRSKKREKGSKVSYDNYYDDDRRNRNRSRDAERGRRNIRAGYDYDDIILETRGEAEDVLDRMDELIDNYGMVSVADLYEMVGIDGRHTDNKYGWTQLRSADIVRLRGDEYWLKLPRALPLD